MCSAYASRLKKLTFTIIMSALACIITIIKLEIPFPLLPFLKFDFAEIPSLLTLFVTMEIKYAIVVATVHFLFLLYRSAFTPIGPLMKYLAVLSMLLGFWLGLHARCFVRSRMKNVIALLLAIVIRSFVMGIMNYLILGYIAPFFLNLAETYLRKIGLTFLSTFDMCLILVTVFNIMHVLLTYVISIFLYNYVKKLLKI